MICSKCMASYPMGFKECPDCGAPSKFAVLESDLSDADVNVIADAEEPIKDNKVPELKITSLTDENMFMEGFVIPESKPPEEPEPPKPTKRRPRKNKKTETEETVVSVPVVNDAAYHEADSEEVAVEEPQATEELLEVGEIEGVASDDKEKVETRVETAPEVKPIKKTPNKSSLFEAMAVEAAQGLAPEGLPKIDTTKVDDLTDVFKECSNIQPLETEEDNTTETACLNGTEAINGKTDTVPVDNCNSSKNSPQSKKTALKVKPKDKSEKTKEISRNLTIASVFGILSLFVPILFIPSNMYLNKIPKDADVKGARVLKVFLNVLFYINLFGLVLGIVSLTKALALNYQSLFAGDFTPLTGEFGKIAPLMIVRTFDFWRSVFSENTVVILKGIFDTYFSEFASELSQLENGFDIKIVFSLFGKIGIPIIVLLSSVGITGKIVYSRKIRALEKKLEKVYQMGNYTGETIRNIKDQKRNLTFKKKGFVKTIIILIILTFILAEGYPVISKILPLLDFIKEDIQNVK
ncbi:MAG: hypothetical protein UGF89_13565 [Acutalibacteraceae bacterium]|nr:hypothetical protein [Acutalibacteraceae bacterium]